MFPADGGRLLRATWETHTIASGRRYHPTGYGSGKWTCSLAERLATHAVHDLHVVALQVLTDKIAFPLDQQDPPLWSCLLLVPFVVTNTAACPPDSLTPSPTPLPSQSSVSSVSRKADRHPPAVGSASSTTRTFPPVGFRPFDVHCVPQSLYSRSRTPVVDLGGWVRDAEEEGEPNLGSS